MKGLIGQAFKELDFYILMGAELEFYVHSLPFIPPFQFKSMEIKKEMGKMQFEAIFPPTFDLSALALEIVKFRFLSKEDASFEAYHASGEPFSALQFNFSVWRKNNGDFSPENNLLQSEQIRNSVLFFLLQDIPYQLKFFIRNDNCKKRLTDLESIKKFRNSPFTISCGGQNNRTAALRLIYEESNKYILGGKSIYGYRIEHRVPSGNCRVFSSISSIVTSIIKGMTSKMPLPLVPILYSNAFEEEIISSVNLQRIIPINIE